MKKIDLPTLSLKNIQQLPGEYEILACRLPDDLLRLVGVGAIEFNLVGNNQKLDLKFADTFAASTVEETLPEGFNGVNEQVQALGYGLFSYIKEKTKEAHFLSWEAKHAPWPRVAKIGQQVIACTQHGFVSPAEIGPYNFLITTGRDIGIYEEVKRKEDQHQIIIYLNPPNDT